MKIERKYMAHYLNATFAADDGTASYVRLGKDLEEWHQSLSIRALITERPRQT